MQKSKPRRTIRNTLYSPWQQARAGKNEKGDYENRTEWHRVYAWSNLSSFAKTLQKGQLITLEEKIKYREVSEEVEGVTFTHSTAEIHATSMKRLSKVEVADDPADGASEDDGAAQTEPEIISPTKRQK
jgi:single-stranded DNA-binding protein